MRVQNNLFYCVCAVFKPPINKAMIVQVKKLAEECLPHMQESPIQGWILRRNTKCSRMSLSPVKLNRSSTVLVVKATDDKLGPIHL